MIIDRRLRAALFTAATLALAACNESPKAAEAPETPAAPAATEPAAPTADAAPRSTPASAASAGDATGLAAYVGKYPFDKVAGVAWNDHPAVAAGIAATVKDAKVRAAIADTAGPSAPIELHEGKVMAWACEAHNCGGHQWAVLVAPANGATDVCYYDETVDSGRARWFLAAGMEEWRDGNCQFDS